MENKEFKKIRHSLGKSQNQLARLLCVSHKAIQSYEQGWRNIPANVERELLFLLSLKMSKAENISPCWDIRNCPAEWRKNCTAWNFQASNFCWFINGTFCQGKSYNNWADKIEICKQCEVFRSLLPAIS